MAGAHGAGVDRQAGLSQRLASLFHDRRHASYIDHDLVDLIRQLNSL